jgi:ADP-ribosylglycohydrolase
MGRTTDGDEMTATASWVSRDQDFQDAPGRFRGCLLGGAVGDALGAPVEFLGRSEILERFGPDGITAYAPAYGGLGRITDDTQMTLFTAEGLLRAHVRGTYRGGASYRGVTAHAYARWLRTQSIEPARALATHELESGWLYQQPELHDRRGPGNTCLEALRTMQSPGDLARNDRKGCGGVMRVAPVGLFTWNDGEPQDPRRAFGLATELAALTHGHPTGSLTAGVLAVLVLALVDGATLEDALGVARAILLDQPGHDETLQALDKARALAAAGMARHAAIAQLGQGWLAEEALAIAIYCALVAEDLREGVVLAVNHDGDSDSTGALAGNLLGAMHGADAIPPEWLAPLELRDVITEIADDLHAYRGWPLGEGADPHASERIWRKYPGA